MFAFLGATLGFAPLEEVLGVPPSEMVPPEVMVEGGELVERQE